MAAAACSALFVLLPTNPAAMPFTYRDSGIFLYAGWRILSGEIPYVHIWDSKPPGVFYVNAVGLALGRGSRWGVWALEMLSLSAAALLLVRLLGAAFGRLAAVLSLLLWALTLTFVLSGGNLTEEYALPLQLACLWLFHHAVAQQRASWQWPAMGALSSLIFILRPNAVAIPAAIFLYTLVRGRRDLRSTAVGRLVGIVLGALLVALLVVLWFAHLGALPQFVDAAFRANWHYVGGTAAGRIRALREGMWALSRVGLLPLAAASWLATVLAVCSRRRLTPSNATPLRLVAMIALPLEMLGISISGRNYAHYFITPLPVLAVLAGWTLRAAADWLERRGLAARARLGLVMAAILAVACAQAGPYAALAKHYATAGHASVVEYVQAVASPGDEVLIWGSQAQVNFFAQRKSPSRFAFQASLYRVAYGDYASLQLAEEFLGDVVARRPALIIDARDGITDQDLTLLGYILDSGRSLVLAINKWDGLPPEQRDYNKTELERRLSFVAFANQHFISALHGTGVGDVMKSIDQAYASAFKQFNTNDLTELLAEAVYRHSPPLHNGRRIKLRYAHQGGRNPPIIVVHGSQTDKLKKAYHRYLMGFFIERLKLKGTPLRLEFKTGTNPYAGKRNTLSKRQIDKKRRLMKHVKGK